jgi:CheY-like chemotaxis protein
MPGILVAVDDLFFLTKIQQTAGLLGITIETVPPVELQQRLALAPYGSIIIDLNHRSGLSLEAVRRVKNESGTSQATVLGFLSHVQTELAEAARAAGCDIVLARSTFSQQLPQWLKKLAGKDASITGT